MKIACCPSYQRCPLSEISELADKGRLHVHVTDGCVVLPLTCRKQPPPPRLCSYRPGGHAACLLRNESICTYLCFYARGVMHAFHFPALCHLRATRTLHTPERFCWLFGKHSAVASLLFGVQSAEKISTDRPSGHHFSALTLYRPGITVSSGYLDPPQVAPRGSTYIAL